MGEVAESIDLGFDKDLEGCTVGDVLADPEKFVGATLADPLEGVGYGTNCAKVMRRPDGSVWINSFAHGRAVYDLQYVFGDELRPGLGAVRRQPVRILGVDVVKPGLLDDPERRASGERVQLFAVIDDGLAALQVLYQRWVQDRRAFEYQALARIHHTVNDRAPQQAAAGASQIPAEAGKPTAIVERAQEALYVSAVPHQREDVGAVRSNGRTTSDSSTPSHCFSTVRRAASTVHPVRLTMRSACDPGSFSPVAPFDMPVLVEERTTRAVCASSGSTLTSAFPEPAERLDLVPHRVRHALGIDVD